MSFAVTFFVAGRPASKGSFSAHVVKGRAIAFAVGAAKIRAWERAVRTVASRYVPEDGPIDCPVEVGLVFAFRRPKKPKFAVPAFPPDGDKCERATLDALTKHIFTNDARVVSCTWRKIYGEVEGCTICVREYVP